MYNSQTSSSSPVQVVDVAPTGRVLVVDDDVTFGRFLAGALGSRGHDVDWAGSKGDGLAALFERQYDLVLLDLRLPDGTGFELLREATDLALLRHSAAMILTGETLEAPADIRILRKPLALDAFLEQMDMVIAQTRRRRHRVALTGGRSDRRAGRVHDSSGARSGAKSLRIELVLFTSASSEKSRRAVRAVESVLERYERSQIKFQVRELSETSNFGERDAIVYTPTLVKQWPAPRTWIVGNLDEPTVLVDLLDGSGVDRKRG